MRQVLVEKGPIQVKNFNFPIESRSGRRFTAVNYKTKLPNGEDIDRTDRYSDWQNMSNFLRTHERSTSHEKAIISYRELATRLQLGHTIDVQHQRVI